MKRLPTQARLKELYTYREDGVFIRNTSRSQCKAGSVAGCGNNTGYQRIEVDGVRILLHRAIFMYHHGYWPEQVDHINGDRSDDRIENLRAATLKQNRQNRTPVRSGLKGAFKIPKGWRAQIKINGKSKHLGCFASEIAAAKAYDKAAIQHFGEFARPNFQL